MSHESAKKSAYRFGKWGLYLGGLVFFCLLLNYFSLLGSLRGPLFVVVGLLLLVLGMPVSLILRVDLLGEWSGIYDPESLLVVAWIILLFNFVLLGALRGYLKTSEEENSAE